RWGGGGGGGTDARNIDYATPSIHNITIAIIKSTGAINKKFLLHKSRRLQINCREQEIESSTTAQIYG
ncbi:hypothetical protein ACJX0J_010637, partial [Zea mays]